MVSLSLHRGTEPRDPHSACHASVIRMKSTVLGNGPEGQELRSSPLKSREERGAIGPPLPVGWDRQVSAGQALPTSRVMGGGPRAERPGSGPSSAGLRASQPASRGLGFLIGPRLSSPAVNSWRCVNHGHLSFPPGGGGSCLRVPDAGSTAEWRQQTFLSRNKRLNISIKKTHVGSDSGSCETPRQPPLSRTCRWTGSVLMRREPGAQLAPAAEADVS